MSDYIHPKQTSKLEIRSIIQNQLLLTHNDPVRHWADDHGSINIDADQLMSTLKEYYYTSSINRNTNINFHSYHRYHFTPKSFCDIINILSELNMIHLIIEKIYTTLRNKDEFYAILRKI